MVENIDDVSYSTRRFLNLGGQVYARHGDNLAKVVEQVGPLLVIQAIFPTSFTTPESLLHQPPL